MNADVMHCPACQRSFSTGFAFCPYCQARLQAGPLLDEPLVARAKSHRVGSRDVTLVGLCLAAFGAMGALGAAMVSGKNLSALGLVQIALFVLLIGSLIAGFGIGRGLVASHGAAAGCASTAVGVIIGIGLFACSIAFLFAACTAMKL